MTALTITWQYAMARLVATPTRRLALVAATAATSGLLGLLATRTMEMAIAGSWVFAGGTFLILFGYGIVFMNLHVLGYFPRSSERFIDRAAVPAVVALLGAVWLAAAPRTVGGVFVIVVMIIIGVRQAMSRKGFAGHVTVGAMWPRSSADAWTMLEIVEIAQRQRLNPRQRFILNVNKANALVALRDDEHAYERLHEAYEILHRLATSPVPVPFLRIPLASALAETAMTLYLRGDDLHIYEHAAQLLDHELARERRVPDIEVRRLINLADLSFLRSGIPGGVPAPEPDRIRALHEALNYCRAALAIAPRHRITDLHLRVAFMCAELGQVLGDGDLISEAISQAGLALATIPRMLREQRPMIQPTLAWLLVYRFIEFEGPLDDLRRAEHLAGAARTSDDPMNQAIAWLTLVSTWRLQEANGMRSADLAAQLAAVHRSVETMEPFSRGRLQLAAVLGAWAAEQHQPQEAAWAYREVLATARRLSATGLMRQQQQAPLLGAVGVAAEAAHWLLECGRPYDAVTAIESSRALVLSSAVNRTRLIRRLEQRDPHLAHRCAQLSARLARVDRIPRTDRMQPGSLWHSLAQRHDARAAHDEWRKVAASLAQWPEFRALLGAPEYAHVAVAARHQPLIYVVAAESTGYALVVLPDATSPLVLTLPDLTSTRLSELTTRFRRSSSLLSNPVHARTSWRSTLSDCLALLDKTVMTPLIGQVRLRGPATLVPVGDLALLPLHAAGDDGGSDGVAWSYAPSAQVLVHAVETARLRSAPAEGRALLVASTGSEGRKLWFTDGARPVLRRYLHAVTPVAAVREPVLSAIGDFDVCHFSCHGAADGTDPLESYLELDDGRLTVRDLLDRQLRARLVVLAACETGVPYAQLPDESIGLPAALLEAGVPGVMSTLWPVEELPTVLLTAKFYEFWLHQRNAPVVALGKAQQWLRNSTIEQLWEYSENDLDGVIDWPYRHNRKAGKYRIFAHPDCWAAFIYTGV